MACGGPDMKFDGFGMRICDPALYPASLRSLILACDAGMSNVCTQKRMLPDNKITKIYCAILLMSYTIKENVCVYYACVYMSAEPLLHGFLSYRKRKGHGNQHYKFNS